MLEHPLAVFRHRLQRQRKHLGRRQGDFARAGGRLLHRLGVGVEVEKAERRQFFQIAEAVEQPRPQAEQRVPAEGADADYQMSAGEYRSPSAAELPACGGPAAAA